jgi:hypothetical protein
LPLDSIFFTLLAELEGGRVRVDRDNSTFVIDIASLNFSVMFLLILDELASRVLIPVFVVDDTGGDSEE